MTGIRKFVFHNYRNAALTHWSRQDVVIAMLSAVTAVQLHKRYVDPQQQDIAKAFGTAGSKMSDRTLQENGRPQ